MMHRRRFTRRPGAPPPGLGLLAAILGTLLPAALAGAQSAPPAPPASITVDDQPWDGGDAIRVRWTRSPDDVADGPVTAYKLYRTKTAAEIASDRRKAIEEAVAEAKEAASVEALGLDGAGELAAAARRIEEDPTLAAAVRSARAAAAEAAEAAAIAAFEARPPEADWLFVTSLLATDVKRSQDAFAVTIPKLARSRTVEAEDGTTRTEPVSYRARVTAMAGPDLESAPVASADGVVPREQVLDGSRLWLAVILGIFGGAVVLFIRLARSGKDLKVRTIAGLAAIDEAVGRATEMGRSVIFVPGIQDMNEIQTIAGITILARVARTAAEYDARVEVPTTRSLVMTTARETVQAAYLEAGRPDAYDEDLIYYVTNEQFGYVAYLSGLMVREKPAACIYMGAFYAESLILAETGNSIGAIQVAGTAQPAQLPFFVAACDYTLIGEEFFAASAYLSGSPEELGSLKGQDVGKLIVAGMLLVGITFATLAQLTGDDSAFMAIVSYMREVVLS